MIRNLKVLIAAAMALAAFGAFSASAHAAEELFHCSVEPCTLTLAPDEATGTTTAHHVFTVKGETNAGAKGVTVSYTCEKLSGEATSSSKTSTEITFTNLKYTNGAGLQKCKVGASETVTSNFTSCDFNFKSAGGATSTAQVHLLCTTAGDAIDINMNGVTCIKVTPFTTTGIGLHDAGVAEEVLTATTSITFPKGSVDLVNVGNVNCAALNLKAIEEVKYTTGNTLIKAETDSPTPTAAKVWFT